MKDHLAIPLDFDRRQTTRLFCRAISGVNPNAMPLLVAYQVWMEWATGGSEWRALRHRVEDPDTHRWEVEDITHIVESFVSWSGETGGLIRCALRSGFMKLEDRQEMSGLVLVDYGRFNGHLDPNFKTIQQLGGEARSRKLREKAIQAEAAQRREVFDSQGILPFGETQVTKEEQELCYALVMRIDRACGAPPRSGDGFGKSLLSDALTVVRTCTPGEIEAVEIYVVENRANPSVVTVPDRILSNFRSYVADATRNA